MTEKAPARILIAEDEKDLAKLLKAHLKKIGYTVYTAYDGLEALELYGQHRPELVILDVQMPRMNGFDVCKELKLRSKGEFLPVIMVTVLQRMDEKIKGLEMGADDFLTKPYNDIELSTRVKNLLKAKELYDTLQKSYQALKELETLKENLMHMIVHDLRVPLTAVVSSLDIVSDNIMNKKSVDKCKNFLDIAKENCKKLVRMIDDLLDIGKLEENKLILKKREVDIENLIWEAVKEIAISFKKKVNLEVQIEQKIDKMFIDRELIIRVIMNLLVNAVKFAKPEGKVTIGVVPLKEELRFSVFNEGDAIPGDYLDKIFEKFVQVESKKMTTKVGVGLGLTFCQLAVKAHGGKIWAESHPGRGSCFYFTLPYK